MVRGEALLPASGGNGEFVSPCRTPSHEAGAGASTMPCALTMTAVDVTTVAAARAQARSCATVSRPHSPWRRRRHDERGRAHHERGGLTMITAQRAERTVMPTLSRAQSPEPPRRRTVSCALTKTAAAVTMAAAQSLWRRRSDHNHVRPTRARVSRRDVLLLRFNGRQGGVRCKVHTMSWCWRVVVKIIVPRASRAPLEAAGTED